MYVGTHPTCTVCLVTFFIYIYANPYLTQGKFTCLVVIFIIAIILFFSVFQLFLVATIFIFYSFQAFDFLPCTYPW